MSENKKIKPPENIDLPFFAYGIFKPNQIAYSKIEKYVEKSINSEINYYMNERDGVPILIDNTSKSNYTQGNILYFKENQKEIAYKKISNTTSKALYEWKTIKIGKEEVNILFGVNTDLGSTIPELSYTDYNGKNDPFFKEAIKLIESNLENLKNTYRIMGFFELQMNYMLLWSAIDRYTHLKYNKNTEKANRRALSNEKVFKDGLKKYTKNKDRKVYSANDITEYPFNLDNPYQCINYYYTIRCNVVHRGKISPQEDAEMVKEATEELLAIFKDILKDTFGEKVD